MKPYKIVDRIQETPDVISLRFVDENDTHPSFIAGQYVTILFPDLNVPSGKAYSLSSMPSDRFLQITVKKSGSYSSRLHELKIGDEMLVSEPYGFLNPEFDAPIVAIAGGVGIAPLISIVHDTLERSPRHQIELWNSNRTVGDIVFARELENLPKQYKNVVIKNFVTRQQNLPKEFISGRIDVPKLLATKKRDPETFFFICGREDFVGEMWRKLTENGVLDSKIATEAFF
jgi:ferredoxin-NADP reductase